MYFSFDAAEMRLDIVIVMQSSGTFECAVELWSKCWTRNRQHQPSNGTHENQSHPNVDVASQDKSHSTFESHFMLVMVPVRCYFSSILLLLMFQCFFRRFERSTQTHIIFDTNISNYEFLSKTSFFYLSLLSSLLRFWFGIQYDCAHICIVCARR